MNCIAQSEPKELQKGYVVIEEGIKEKMMALNVFEQMEDQLTEELQKTLTPQSQIDRNRKLEA